MPVASQAFPSRYESLLFQALYAIAENGVNLQTLTVERNAISSLLLGLCDAVVEVDESLGFMCACDTVDTVVLRPDAR